MASFEGKGIHFSPDYACLPGEAKAWLERELTPDHAILLEMTATIVPDGTHIQDGQLWVKLAIGEAILAATDGIKSCQGRFRWEGDGWRFLGPLVEQELGPETRRVRIEGAMNTPVGYSVTVRDLATGKPLTYVKRIDITLEAGNLNMAKLTRYLTMGKGDLPPGGIIVGGDGEPIIYQEETFNPELAITAMATTIQVPPVDEEGDGQH